jgi:hypothetical protein
MKQSAVDLILRGERFVVRVTELGKVTEQDFTGIHFALSWASGQSVRLGLRLPDQPVFTSES